MKNRTFLAAILVFQAAVAFSQVRWTRDDLFLNPSGIPSDGVTSFAVADMDSDKWLDLALVQDGILYLYRQFPNALPRFRVIPDYFKGITFLKAGSSDFGSGIALYDFDGDGDADLLVGWTESEMRYFARAFGKLAYFRNDFTVGVHEASSLPTLLQFDLRQNYPNPFTIVNGQHGTAIQFSLREAGHIRINLYNLLGQHLRTLMDEFGERGEHKIEWNGRTAAGAAVAPGIYLLRLENETFSVTRKILMLP